MRRSLLALALFLAACGTKAPNPQPEPKKDPAPTSPAEPTPTLSGPSVDGWPERPAAIVIEARIEGLLPSISAAIGQARKVTEIPPVEGMLYPVIAGAFGLSDPGALNLDAPAGLLLVDLPQNPSPVLYLGIKSEEDAKKAFPAPQGAPIDAKGNALAIPMPAALASELGGATLYLNFLDGNLVASPTPEAFAKAQDHLKAVFAQKASAPAFWLDVEVGTLWRAYGKLAGPVVESALQSAPPTPGIDMKAMFSSLTNLLGEIEELELRYTPREEGFQFSAFVTPSTGTELEKRFATPGPEKNSLADKLPAGWLAGVAYTSPETFRGWMEMSKQFTPSMGAALEFATALADQATGEFAMSAGTGSGFSFVGAFGVKDAEAVKAALRKAYEKPNTIESAGGISVVYQAIAADAEELGGQKVDKLAITYDLSKATDPMMVSQFQAMGMSEMTLYYAYLPGVLVFALGESQKAALEAMLKGEPGTFGKTPLASAALGLLPKPSLASFFLSVPQMMKSMMPAMLVPVPVSPAAPGAATVPAETSGIVFGWSVEKGRLRADLAVPIAHALELKEALSPARLLAPPPPSRP
jgi:hypothetical protein